MPSQGCVYLMYHELELPARATCKSAPGYLRYVLTAPTFQEQMRWMKDSGYRGVNVSEALDHPRQSVCITFDDGCETDLIVAAPLLHEFGFGATFYLTAGFLGTKGYLRAEQVRELDASGFEIGCHSMTHPYLSDLAEPELRREIVDAKLMLEDIVGHGIEHFSIPGGRYDARTLDTARTAGFRAVATSEVRVNSPKTSPYKLGRVAIYRNTPLPEFASICAGQGLWKKRLQDRTRQAIRSLVGNRAYDQMRVALLRGRGN